MKGKSELPLNRAEARFETAQQITRRQREEQRDAVQEKTERLRALRLAKEAETEAAAEQAK
jgi:hypothetical protein